MTRAYTSTGRELAKAIVADLNSGDEKRAAKARKTAPAIDKPTDPRDASTTTTRRARSSTASSSRDDADAPTSAGSARDWHPAGGGSR